MGNPRTTISLQEDFARRRFPADESKFICGRRCREGGRIPQRLVHLLQEPTQIRGREKLAGVVFGQGDGEPRPLRRRYVDVMRCGHRLVTVISRDGVTWKVRSRRR